MKKRMIWAGTVLLCTVLYLFENNAGTLTVLVGALVLPAAGLIFLLGNRVEIKLTVDSAREKEKLLEGKLTVTNGGLLPVPRLSLTVSCRNLRTGQAASSPLTVSLLPKQRVTIPVTLSCRCCGKLQLRAEQGKVEDVFGLFGRRIDAGAEAETVLLPRLFAPAIHLEQQDMAMPDSDCYAQTHPGSDPGETFAIREYAPGDAIRQIHWKLSEKTGQTMVRLFGMPVVNEVALLLENAGSNAPEETDAVTEVFASISHGLIRSGIHHRVFWSDGERGGLLECDITSPEDFAAMLGQLLELPPRQGGSVAQRFTRLYPHCPYSHVIAVGSQIPEGIGTLSNGNRVSVVIPRGTGIPEGLQGDGTYVLSFTQDGYAQELCALEV